MPGYSVAIVGATGAVGREMVGILENSEIPVDSLTLLATQRSAGKKLSFADRTIVVRETRREDLPRVDIALFSAGSSASLEYAPLFAEQGALVIDNSSAFRMEDDVPLVVPEVNPGAIAGHRGIVANPNCSTIQMVVPLSAIREHYGIARVVVSTYQAVSGTGMDAIEELREQSMACLRGEEVSRSVYPVQIAFNALPHIDVFQDHGYTKEEWKMVLETRKILELPDLPVTATTVRIPVLNGHSEAVNIEMSDAFELEELKEVLDSAPGIRVVDDPQSGLYPTPLDVDDTDDILVGRIRRDLTVTSGCNLWIVANNLRKGAALNAVQIAERAVQMNIV